MDHKVSKDMISSGMIPSGEKTQADLGRTQYGSAPSPNKLMDAYKSMYDKKEEVINEHHKKDADGNTIPHEDEELNEGKIPAGLQAYLDKKKGKKEDKKDMKEQYNLVYEHFIGEGFSEEETYERMSNLTEEQLDEFMKALATRAAQYGANLGKEKKVDFIGGIQKKPFEAKRKPFDPKPKPGEQGFKAKSPTDVVMSAAAMNRKKQTVSNQTEQIDTYDIVLDHFLNEGYKREDILKVMSTVNLTEEPITATLATIGAGLLKGAAVAAKGAAIAGKTAVAAGTKGLAAAGKGIAAGSKAAMKGVVSAAKPVTQSISKSATAVKDLGSKGLSSAKDIASKGVSSAKDVASNVGQQVKKVTSQPTGGSGEDRLKRLKDFAKRETENTVRQKVLQGGQPSGTNKTGLASAKTTDIAASADLFDIVKGQLLDEGLSEEEIRDIMLTLTPDEIMNEMNQGPSTPVKNYGDSPDKPKILPNFGATRAKPRTTDKGTIIKGGKDTGKTPAQMSQEEYKNFDPKKPDPKQMAAQAKQEKNRQKFNDPMGVKNKNIGGQGLDPMDK